MVLWLLLAKQNGFINLGSRLRLAMFGASEQLGDYIDKQASEGVEPGPAVAAARHALTKLSEDEFACLVQDTVDELQRRETSAK